MIGKGIYSLAEASRYADTAYATARSWFHGRPDHNGNGPVLDSDYDPIDGDFAISFLDLIDLLVAARFRNAGVQLHVIRKAYQALGEELDTPHPFSHRELYTNGRDVIIQTADSVGNATLQDVISKQLCFTCLRQYLEHIEYDATSDMAERWHIATGITIDPQVSFGKPVIENTGTSALILARQYRANHKDAALVADLFNVSESDVVNAVRFEGRYGRRRAA